MGPSNTPLTTDPKGEVTAGGTSFQSIPPEALSAVTKSIDIEVMVGPHTGFDSDIRYLHLRVKELPDTLNDVTHASIEDHQDLVIPLYFDDWSHWELVPPTKPGDPSRWRLMGNNSPAGSFNGTNTPQTYTTRLSWNTISSLTRGFGVSTNSTPGHLLGHNGDHIVQIVGVTYYNSDYQSPDYGQLYYNTQKLRWKTQPQTGQPTTSEISLPIKYATTVRNLSISGSLGSLGNGAYGDYIAFDSNSQNPTLKTPRIYFNISDIGDPHLYKWELRLRSTKVEQSNWIVYCRGQLSEPGSVNVNVNAPVFPNTQQGQLTEAGTYTFDLTVTEVDPNAVDEFGHPLPEPLVVDQQSWRSPHLLVPPLYDVDKPGYLLHNDWIDDQLHAKLDYYLQDTNKDAIRAHVDVLGPEWDNKAWVDVLVNVNTPHLNQEIFTYPAGAAPSSYRMVLSAQDDHGAEYRDHENKRMLAVNAQRESLQERQISIICTDSQEGAPDAVSGLDISTVTAGTVTFSVVRNGGEAQNSSFAPSVVHPEGISGDAITMLLDYNFSVGNDYHYALTMTVAAGGMMDKVGNEFDIDGDRTNGIQRTYTFKFHLEEENGNITVVED